ncbi:MAG TPA: hypothetical protein VMV07_21095 [Streptosporangiaceae bacterium]|nr:hypothetical protein [Streptosporangiaceae bacterium]
MGGRAGLAAIEAIIDASGVAPAVEALLPAGVRHRQLTARTLLTGMMLAIDGRRPAYLTEARAALTCLPEADQARLGVTEDWKTGPHQLTYRQTEHTFGLVAKALAKEQPDGAPSGGLAAFCDNLLEASIPGQHKDPAGPQAPASLAADWTDVEAWSRPPRHDSTECADPEAHWGHRNSNLPGPKGEMFFGYYLSLAVMTREENGPPVPELARRMTVGGCDHDPVRQFAGTLLRMAEAGIPLGDIIDDSGYAHRDAEAWAVPLRNVGAQLVQDLHPHDRGPRGTHQGAIIANGNLYCPCTPKPLLELGPPSPGAPAEQVAAHDQQTAELARHKLGRHTGDDTDGYHRVGCPAAAGKIRCPLRPDSMKLDRDRPEILTPPQQPPACCTQHTITVPPAVAAKTRQKHDYPSAAWRRSYTRRTSAERANATLKDTATSNIARGWIRLMGLTPLTLWLACALVIRNQRILAAWDARQDDNARRAAASLPPRTRKRRRTSLAELAAGPP